MSTNTNPQTTPDNQKHQRPGPKRRSRSFDSDNSFTRRSNRKTKEAKNKMQAGSDDTFEKHTITNEANDGKLAKDRSEDTIKIRTRSFYLDHVDVNENKTEKKNGMYNETVSSRPDSEGNVKGHNKARTRKEIPGGPDSRGGGNGAKRRSRSFYSERVDTVEGIKKLKKPQNEVKSSNAGNKSSIAKNEIPARVRCSRNDYNLPPPNENSCELSNDWSDCCKTLCKVCDKPYGLTHMRNHTVREHSIQITKYKETYGPFIIIDVVYHKCQICGKLVLLDGDILGAHIKNAHNMKEKEYSDLYMIRRKEVKQAANSTKKFKLNKPKGQLKKKLDKMIDFEFDFNKIEYDCNVKECKLCGHSPSHDLSGTSADYVKDASANDVRDTSADDIKGAEVGVNETKYFLDKQNSEKRNGVTDSLNKVNDQAKVFNYDSADFNCNEDFSTAIEMELNTKRQDESMDKPYACEECDYKSIDKANLMQHIKIHTGEKPYSCPECDYKSSEKATLTRHMRTHSGEKPYACEECDYKSIEASKLKVHMRTHSGEKPFACEECDYKSTNATGLKRHIRIHTGEKPYQCEICEKRFAQLDQLKFHRKRLNKCKKQCNKS